MHARPLHTLMVPLLALAALAGCAQPVRGPWVEVASQRFRVEVVDNDATRTRGLMFRERLDADAGMLFVFEAEQPLAFWMKNTLIPLDILYFDNDGVLVSMAERTPPCRSGSCPTYPSARPARFVLELNAGTAKSLGIRPGARITFSPDIRRE